MDRSALIIQFKKDRYKFKKRSLNVTVVEERLSRIENAIIKNSQVFDLLGFSERLDFMIFMLESFMINSPEFDIEAKNDAEAV